MAQAYEPAWPLPAEFPFTELEARDHKECIYWLLDALGTKELEWRLGGAAVDVRGDLAGILTDATIVST